MHNDELNAGGEQLKFHEKLEFKILPFPHPRYSHFFSAPMYRHFLIRNYLYYQLFKSFLIGVRERQNFDLNFPTKF